MQNLLVRHTFQVPAKPGRVFPRQPGDATPLESRHA
jgi:hypothetical protein